MILSLRRQRGQVVERMLDPACAILSLLNTAAMFGLLCVIYPRPEHRPMLGVVSLGLAGAHAAAVVLVRARGFAASSLLQSAALVTLAFPLLLDQFAITLAWLALAGVLAALAWQLNLPAARGWAIVLLLLSVWRLVSFDSGLRSEVVWSIGSFTVSRWMLMAWASAILAHGIAWLSPGGTGLLPGLQSRIAELLPTPKRFAGAGGALEGGGAGVLDYATAATDESHLLRRLDPVGVFVSACGTLCYVAAVASAYQGSALTLLLIVWTAAIVALGGVDRRLGYLPHASVLAGLVSINWLLVDALAPIVEHWSYPRAKGLPLPLINSVAGNGALLSATIWGLWMQWRRSRVATVSETHTLIVWAAILLLVMLNVEACRFVDWLVVSGSAAISDVANVKQVVMSVLWATTGFVAVLIGFRRNIAALRYAALALLGLTLLKILLIDMAEVKAVWRILSFVVVGGLLLAVSYLYHRQSEGRAPTN
jgi:uncharacterized membrane protein